MRFGAFLFLCGLLAGVALGWYLPELLGLAPDTIELPGRVVPVIREREGQLRDLLEDLDPDPPALTELLDVEEDLGRDTIDVPAALLDTMSARPPEEATTSSSMGLTAARRAGRFFLLPFDGDGDPLVQVTPTATRVTAFDPHRRRGLLLTYRHPRPSLTVGIEGQAELMPGVVGAGAGLYVERPTSAGVLRLTVGPAVVGRQGVATGEDVRLEATAVEAGLWVKIGLRHTLKRWYR